MQFGYLRALRGVFQPLIGSARRQELSVREEDLLRTCNLRISNLIEFTLRNGTQDLLSFSFDEVDNGLAQGVIVMSTLLLST